MFARLVLVLILVLPACSFARADDPVLVVYDFTSAFDNGKMGKWVADMVRGHARRSGMYLMIDPLTFDGLIAQADLKVTADTDPQTLADFTRKTFVGDIFIFGGVTRKGPEGYELAFCAYSVGKDKPEQILDETQELPRKEFFSTAVDALLKKLAGVGEARDEWKALGERLKAFSAQWLNAFDADPDAPALTTTIRDLSRDLAATERKLTSYRMAEQANAEIMDQFKKLSAQVDSALLELDVGRDKANLHARQAVVDASRISDNIRDWLDDDKAELRAKSAPNLVRNGDFAFGQNDPANWDTLKPGITWVPNPDAKAPADKCIRMDVDKNTAENAGMLYYSAPFAIEEGATYRFAVRYRTASPTLKVFVKCYDLFPEKWGFGEQPREVYRCQINVYPPDDSKTAWNTYTRDFVPYTANVNHPCSCRIMLYAYLQPGVVFWDDVVVKKIKDAPRRQDTEAKKAE